MLDALPRGGTWQVDALPLPGGLGDLWVVVTRKQGLRWAGPSPDGKPETALLRATERPQGSTTPERPRRIQCRAPVKARVAAYARRVGARIEVVRRLRALDREVEHLLDALSGVATHQEAWLPLPHDPPAWATALRELVDAAPWLALTDSVTFHFPEPGPLQHRVAVVLGLAGLQRGLAVYPSEAARVAHRTGEGVYDPALLIAVEPIEELPSDAVDKLRALGLVHDGFALQLFSVLGAGSEAPSLAEEANALLATRAVLAAWSAHGESLADAPTSTVSPDGLAVFATPQPGTLRRVSLLLEGKERLGFTVGADVVVTLAKPDAHALARALEGVDTLTLRPTGHEGEYDLIANRGAEPVGVVACVQGSSFAWACWRGDGQGRLLISAGGARRRSWSPRSVVCTLQPTLAGAAERVLPDLEGASWSGPVDTWPKASAVLQQWLVPLRLAQLPREVAENLVEVCTMLWNGIVVEQVRGDGSFLEDALASVRGAPKDVQAAMGMLIRRKRRLFPDDTRVMRPRSVTNDGETFHVTVEWTPLRRAD